MQRDKVKPLGLSHGCEVWWDSHLQLWTIQRLDRNPWPEGGEARYIAGPTLRNMDEAEFVEHYLKGD